jgi:hypothetical protein
VSLLQNPERALDQVDWYLNHGDQEKFPGAFLKAAGNLARQTLEQVLFILAFYSRLPKLKYIRSDRKIRSAGRIASELREVEPTTGKTYLRIARERSPRIAKFAALAPSFDRWIRLLNEASHFRNPARRREFDAEALRKFTVRLRGVLDEADANLITAAFNELATGGKVWATIDSAPPYQPGICRKVILQPRHITYSEGRLRIAAPAGVLEVVPAHVDVPIRMRGRPVIVEGVGGLMIHAAFVTKAGWPVDITSLATILASLAKDPPGERSLKRRFQRLGLSLKINRRFETGGERE